MQIKIVHFDTRGLDMFLGALGAACMRSIWRGNTNGRAIYRDVREHYVSVKTDEIAYTSVLTTIGRLYNQGLLTRAGDRHDGYIYAPIYITETAFVNFAIDQVFNVLYDNYPLATGRALVARLRANGKASAQRINADDVL